MAGLYLHIPFCNKKCLYCDFFSGNQLYLIDNYVDALIKEMSLRHEYIEDSFLDTIYFGGGTPSLLSEIHLAKLFSSIHKNFRVRSDAEITIECNPENINMTYVDYLFSMGINRISLGIQFLNNAILEKYNRNHSKEVIFDALEYIERSSFSNLSVDLIYSVPEIDQKEVSLSLNQLFNYNIKHVSAYSLTIASDTQLFWKIKAGIFKENNEDQFLSQYQVIYDFLVAKGFKQYEISNFALEGFYSRHNLAYWNQIPYIGVGVSSHSYNHKSRQWNHKNIKKYIRDLSGSEGNVCYEVEQLSNNQIYNEYIILKLRTFQGLSRNFISSNFDYNIINHFDTKMKLLKNRGHFIFENDLIIPKESDLVISDFLADILMY
ncbi:MAG TPA: radical SAM family heme chaperone HemW [Prolixibacteraceae bacterium]